jgi:DNA adenine methylase
MALERPSHQLYPSPLRYPGGKGKLANYIKLVMLENDLVGSEYVEPYAGGASVALSLLFEEYASHIHINDLNRSIYTLWRVILERPDELNSRIREARLNVREWDRQRKVQTAPNPDELDLAFSTIYLNRTNRSGIIGGGIIGGRKQTGTWKMDARWRPEDLIQRIEKIARFAGRITVTGHDTAEYLQKQLPGLGPVFLYLDPPYYGKGRGLYESFYVHDDHAEVARLIQAIKQPWLVSYDAVPEIAALYESTQSVSYGLNYTARHRVEGSEVMFFGPSVRIPITERPSAVSMQTVHEAQLAA